MNQLGFVFDGEDLRKFSGGRIPTGMSFLRAILSRRENLTDPRLQPYLSGARSDSPYVNFYRDYLRGGKPGFVPIEDIPNPDAIATIRGMGAVPVLAHPSDTGEENLLALVAKRPRRARSLYAVSPSGGAGRISNFAAAQGLLVTAGSDFHGKADQTGCGPRSGREGSLRSAAQIEKMVEGQTMKEQQNQGRDLRSRWNVDRLLSGDLSFFSVCLREPGASPSEL